MIDPTQQAGHPTRNPHPHPGRLVIATRLCKRAIEVMASHDPNKAGTTVVSTLAGNARGHADGVGDAAGFYDPRDIVSWHGVRCAPGPDMTLLSPRTHIHMSFRRMFCIDGVRVCGVALLGESTAPAPFEHPRASAVHSAGEAGHARTVVAGVRIGGASGCCNHASSVPSVKNRSTQKHLVALNEASPPPTTPTPTNTFTTTTTTTTTHTRTHARARTRTRTRTRTPNVVALTRPFPHTRAHAAAFARATRPRSS